MKPSRIEDLDRAELLRRLAIVSLEDFLANAPDAIKQMSSLVIVWDRETNQVGVIGANHEKSDLPALLRHIAARYES